MDDRLALELVTSAIAWPAVILWLHYWYVRKRRHPDWVPWRASGRFIWALLWPTLLAIVVVSAALKVSGAEEYVKTVGPVIGLFVVFPAFYRARRLITEPPKK